MSEDQIGETVVAEAPDSAAIALSEQGDTAVVRLRGPLDAALTRSLGDALTWAVNHHSAVFVDLSAVPAVDPFGLGALVRAQHRAVGMGTALCLVAPSQPVLKALRALRLDDVFAVVDNVPAAFPGGVPARTGRP